MLLSEIVNDDNTKLKINEPMVQAGWCTLRIVKIRNIFIFEAIL